MNEIAIKIQLNLIHFIIKIPDIKFDICLRKHINNNEYPNSTLIQEIKLQPKIFSNDPKISQC